eukprot:jgi/Chrzof1/7379/Cz02g21190.t1
MLIYFPGDQPRHTPRGLKRKTLPLAQDATSLRVLGANNTHQRTARELMDIYTEQPLTTGGGLSTLPRWPLPETGRRDGNLLS